MRIAVISDIHGNVLALEAVLSDIAHQKADLTVNLGDTLSGALWPGQTAERLMSLNLPTVRGNHERQLLTVPRAKMGASDGYAHDEATPAQLAWLASLPETHLLPEDVLLVHAAPTGDLIYLLETVEASGVRPATFAEIERRLVGTSAPLILCGHTHLPRTVRLPGGSLIVNPGSVGLPAYEDDVPFPHAMETGTPHARYAIADNADGFWQVERRKVVYDWNAAAERAESNGRPDAAQALRSGYVMLR